jgi:hypothetical protein
VLVAADEVRPSRRPQRQGLRHGVREALERPATAIAAKAECNRDAVYEALKVLETAGVLTWQNRIVRNEGRGVPASPQRTV